MRRSLLFGLGAGIVAASQQSVSVFTVVVPGLSTATDAGNAISTKLDTVTWVNNVTTTTVYVCPSGSSSGTEETTTLSIVLSSASEAEASLTPSTTVTTANATTSPPAALPTAAGEHINFEGSMMGLVVFCALGLLIL